MQDILIARENYGMENNRAAQGQEKTLLSVDIFVYEYEMEN